MLAASLSKRGLTVQGITAVESEATSIQESFEPAVLETPAASGSMEPASPPVPFPLLSDYKTYQPLSFPLRKPSDSLKELTPLERQWVGVFKRSISSFRDRAAEDSSVEEASKKADLFAERYTELLDDFEKDPESHGGPPDITMMCRLRDVVLREVGFTDIFKSVKEEENSKAVQMLASHLKRVDEIENLPQRMEYLVKGVLAGNVFDLGASNTAEMFKNGELSFDSSFEKLLSRPWVIDDLESFVGSSSKKLWRKVVMFVDNCGADTVLGVLPLAREFCRSGAQVVLAGNDTPTINDMTYSDLLHTIHQVQTQVEDDVITLALDKGHLLIVNSGSDTPTIDLAATSPELAFASDGAELVVLVGMARAIETNLNVEFSCDSLNVGLIKHQEVADLLGGRLFDGVVKYRAVEMPPTPSRVIKQPASLN